ncbi:protein eva-1 homolog C isoform X7 [Osmia bicornis bicornis]|uniref:protein eva-1 homolog C isoform X7 n=1 Tax=Osmia bicornis bicornis TaxID=1437191 RepID=UPI0010F90374|nr:protein eva-1 homolog C isoform X7 [Osmia bicornis bicornis]
MLTIVLLLLLGQPAARADYLTLLSGTLKTYQRAACDEELMMLKCPPGTMISVALAQYGRAGANGTGRCGALDPSLLLHDKQTNQTCIWPQSLQYSLLQTVVEQCHKKRQCKFNTSPKTFEGDPCPGLPKYIEVAYKCRPYEFRSKVACENDHINLACHPGQRVAIFSASFGRTEYESHQCPQPHDVKEETCIAPHATEIVINMCHGKRRCTVVANSSTFGEPCSLESRTYLKIIYTCVPRTVLREQYGGDVEPDEVNLMHEFEEGFDRADFRAEFSPSPNLEGPLPQPRDNVSRNFPTVSSSPPRARTNNDENQEKFYLYIIVSVTAGILIFLGLVIGRLLVSRHRAKRDAKFHANNEPLPNGFTDDISEIDADIDLTTAMPVPMQDTRNENLIFRIPETQLAERLHGDRYYADTRIPMSPTTIHPAPGHHPGKTGVRVDLGNHMVGTDSLHTILRPENPRSLNTKSYYYG